MGSIVISGRRSKLCTALLFTAALVAGTLGIAPAATAGQTNTGAVSGPALLSPDVAATVQGTGQQAQERALAAFWTAGHCVSDGAAWNYNWTFVPNYVNGSAPYGYWYAYQLWTTNAWFYNNNDFANDVGAVVMNRNAGWRITDYFGGQGIAWNYPI